MTQEIDVLEGRLEQFESFLALIDQAHQAEFPLPMGLELPGETASMTPVGPRPSKVPARDPARAAPFLLRALSRYEIMERDDWLAPLEDGLLGQIQVTQVRRAAYEELLWLADDVTRRQQDHRTGRQIAPHEAARAGLAYLRKADVAFPPTSAFYRIRARCRKALEQEEAARADEELAGQTPAAIALDHYLPGLAAAGDRNYAEAIKQFEAALRVEPSHYWSLLEMAYCLVALGMDTGDKGHYATAVAALTGSIMTRPNYVRAYQLRGVAYNQLKRYDEALADNTKALELDPTNGFTWNNRGNVYFNRNQFDKALADYCRALDLVPEDPLPWSNRGRVYNQLGHHDKALADFSKAIELDAKFATAWNGRGGTRQKLNQLDEAIADHTQAIELNAKFAAAWNDRGWARQLLNQLDEAVADHTRAIELAPEFIPAWINRSAAYLKRGESEKAIADSSKVIELDAKFAPAWNNRGAARQQLNQLDEAVADHTRAVELDPKVAVYWSDRGWARQRLNQLDEAIADHSRAVELDPKFTLAWTNRSAAYLAQGDWDKARADASRAIELDAAFAAAWFNRGAAHHELGKFEEAIADYRIAIRTGTEAKADIPQAPARLAAALNSLAWRLATAPDPKLRAPERAVELAKEAVELNPAAGAYWNTLGVAQYRARDWKAAIEALTKSMKITQDGDPFDGFFLAMTHWQLDRKEEARRWYDQAARWMDANRPNDEQLGRVRVEAQELLGLKEKND